ncbi:MAG: hypothetical protein RIC35_15450 [Marinoscillum sp.]
METTKRWAWLTMLFIGMISISITSCNDDEGDTNPDGEEVETAWVIGYRVETPQGRVYYLEAHENLPSATNTSEAVELGLNSRIYSYGENPYTWNGDAATITKWEVNKSTLALSPVGIISFASTGVTGNIAEPAFVSETQAFTTSLAEGVVVEWNPTTMQITEVHEVDAFPIPEAYDGLLFEFRKEVTEDGKIIIPIETNAFPVCCTYPVDAAGARTAIFDPVTATVTYQLDNRLLGSDNSHFTDPVTGIRYCAPVYGNSFVPPYFDNAESLPSAHSLLRVNDDGTFDASYEYNLEDVLDIEFYGGTSFIYNNKVVISYVGDDYTWGSFDERFNVFSLGNFKSAVIDMETNEVSSFDALSDYDGAYSVGTIGDQTFLRAVARDTEGNQITYILEQNAIDSYTEITEHIGGNIEHFNKLW